MICYWKRLFFISIAALGVLYILYAVIQKESGEKVYHSESSETPKTLYVVEQDIKVHGRSKKVFNIVQADGSEGASFKKGDNFNVILKNRTQVPVAIHWHGLLSPNDQDGVAYVTQLPIKPHHSRHYFFKLNQTGTYWMHSHYRLHEQEMMAAPLIITDPKDQEKFDRDVTVLLHDFSFKPAKTILNNLKTENAEMSEHHGMHHHMHHQMTEDLNDVKYDAMLANRHTLSDPEVYWVKPGDRVRLRMINGAAATNFWVYTGELDAKFLALDANAVKPITDQAFQLAVAQRVDLEVLIPKEGGVFPIMAQVEGLKQRAGIILATKGQKIPEYSEYAERVAPALNDDQDRMVQPQTKSFADRPVQATLHYKLSGDMGTYVWKINDEVWPAVNPLEIKQGDRVRLVFHNNTMMAHPMHLHGHFFKLTHIDDQPIKNGPIHDTILVMPQSSKTIEFDADNPGIWMMHCHVLYHMASGMMTTVNYQNYPEPSYYRELLDGQIKGE